MKIRKNLLVLAAVLLCGSHASAELMSGMDSTGTPMVSVRDYIDAIHENLMAEEPELQLTGLSSLATALNLRPAPADLVAVQLESSAVPLRVRALRLSPDRRVQALARALTDRLLSRLGFSHEDSERLVIPEDAARDSIPTRWWRLDDSASVQTFRYEVKPSLEYHLFVRSVANRTDVPTAYSCESVGVSVLDVDAQRSIRRASILTEFDDLQLAPQETTKSTTAKFLRVRLQQSGECAVTHEYALVARAGASPLQVAHSQEQAPLLDTHEYRLQLQPGTAGFIALKVTPGYYEFSTENRWSTSTFSFWDVATDPTKKGVGEWTRRRDEIPWRQGRGLLVDSKGAVGVRIENPSADMKFITFRPSRGDNGIRIEAPFAISKDAKFPTDGKLRRVTFAQSGDLLKQQTEYSLTFSGHAGDVLIVESSVEATLRTTKGDRVPWANGVTMTTGDTPYAPIAWQLMQDGDVVLSLRPDAASAWLAAKLVGECSLPQPLPTGGLVNPGRYVLTNATPQDLKVRFQMTAGRRYWIRVFPLDNTRVTDSELTFDAKSRTLITPSTWQPHFPNSPERMHSSDPELNIESATYDGQKWWSWTAIATGSAVFHLKGVQGEGVLSLGIRDIGSVRPGTKIVLRRHSAVEGTTNWRADMEAHVGEESATASPEYLDPVGMPEVLVEKDARRYLWRTLDVPGADVAISNGAPLCK